MTPFPSLANDVRIGVPHALLGYLEPLLRLAKICHMSMTDPTWLGEARDICRKAKIKIAGHGADALVVYAEPPVRAAEVSSLLAPLGLRPVQDEDDTQAGLLTLSRDPERLRATERQAGIRRYSDFSRRPVAEQLPPILWLLLFFCSVWLSLTQPASRGGTIALFGSFLLFVGDGARIWGWSVRPQTDGLAMRRYFRWTVVPWNEISAVETGTALSRYQEAVILTTRNGSMRMGTFSYKFARVLRDHLREEVAMRST